MTGAPVIPVAQWGAQEVIGPYRKEFRILPRKAMRVTAGPPVDLDDLRGRPLDAEDAARGDRAHHRRDHRAARGDPRARRRPPSGSTSRPTAPRQQAGTAGTDTEERSQD